MRIKSEIIGRHFQPSTIIAQSQIEMTDSAKYAQAAVELIKNFDAAEYRIEVGEETLSIADYTAEREQRTEYLTAVGQFLSQAGQIVQGNADAMPFLLKMVQWVTASFRSSSDIETVLDEAIAQASQPKPQQDPAAAEMAKEQAKGQVTMQLEQGKAQAQAQIVEMQEQNKTAIVQMQTESAERIATMNNEARLMVEQLKAELTQGINDAKLSSEEGKRQMTLMLERMRIVQDALMKGRDHQNAMELAEFDAANQPEPEEPEEPEEKGPDKDAMLIEVLGKLAESIGKPRTKRVKSRDAAGNIMEVEES
jgi:hypothetical protein